MAIVTERRREAAALTYYARSATLPVLAWPGPGGVPDDHFQMTVPLTEREAGPVLAVAPCADPTRFARGHDRVTPLGRVSVAAGPGRTREVWLFRLEGPRMPIRRPADCP